MTNNLYVILLQIVFVVFIILLLYCFFMVCKQSRNKQEDIAKTSHDKVEEIPTPIKNKRILIISDIHYPLNENELKIMTEDFDFCLLLGDVQKETLKYLSFNAKYPVYGVFGNHDTNDMFRDIKGFKNIHRHCVIKEDETSIIGINGSTKYKENTPYCMFSQEEVLDIIKDMRKVDILISHDSPYQIHSTSMNKEGFKGITEYIKEKKPKLHIYGHHHNFKSYMLDETLCICNYRLGVIEKDGIYHTINTR